jgi:hypothetical protein
MTNGCERERARTAKAQRDRPGGNQVGPAVRWHLKATRPRVGCLAGWHSPNAVSRSDLAQRSAEGHRRTGRRYIKVIAPDMPGLCGSDGDPVASRGPPRSSRRQERHRSRHRSGLPHAGRPSWGGDCTRGVHANLDNGMDGVAILLVPFNCCYRTILVWRQHYRSSWLVGLLDF